MHNYYIMICTHMWKKRGVVFIASNLGVWLCLGADPRKLKREKVQNPTYRQAGWGGKELRLTLLVSLGSFSCLLSHVQIKVVGYNMMEAECGRSVIHLYVLVQCGMVWGRWNYVSYLLKQTTFIRVRGWCKSGVVPTPWTLFHFRLKIYKQGFVAK